MYPRVTVLLKQPTKEMSHKMLNYIITLCGKKNQPEIADLKRAIMFMRWKQEQNIIPRRLLFQLKMKYITFNLKMDTHNRQHYTNLRYIFRVIVMIH